MTDNPNKHIFIYFLDSFVFWIHLNLVLTFIVEIVNKSLRHKKRLKGEEENFLGNRFNCPLNDILLLQ